MFKRIKIRLPKSPSCPRSLFMPVYSHDWLWRKFQWTLFHCWTQKALTSFPQGQQCQHEECAILSAKVTLMTQILFDFECWRVRPSLLGQRFCMTRNDNVASIRRGVRGNKKVLLVRVRATSNEILELSMCSLGACEHSHMLRKKYFFHITITDDEKFFIFHVYLMGKE